MSASNKYVANPGFMGGHASPQKGACATKTRSKERACVIIFLVEGESLATGCSYIADTQKGCNALG